MTLEVKDNATNGDIINSLFPNTESRKDEKTGIMLVKWTDGTTKCFKSEWWERPYIPKLKGDLYIIKKTLLKQEEVADDLMN